MSDLISRKEAIKTVKFYETFYDPYPRVVEAVEELPSAQPRKGKWIEASEDWRNQITWWQCSECGTPSSIKSNFCPNCGCRMEEGDSE